jgi:hypothetical protein
MITGLPLFEYGAMPQSEGRQVMNWVAWTAIVFGALFAALLSLGTYGRYCWAKATQVLLSQLEAARVPASSSRYSVDEIRGLPAPVQRYFRAVLRDGQPIVTGATVRHTGTFNVTAFSSRPMWFPFTSEQNVETRRPGFVWNARMELLPGIAIHVHDAYVAGIGTLHPAVLGLFSLTHQNGSGDIARGELMRYMMEATWYPTALLPSQGTTWVAVDDVSADATMVDGDIRMTMRYTFDAAGLVTTIVAASRGALVDGKVVMLPWEGRMSNYQEREGMRVPLTGEAAWLGSDGRKPYWRGTITSLVYAFAQ